LGGEFEVNKKFNQLSEENKNILELWDTGQSATAIGKQFNITRNSVMGRVYRARQAGVKMARYKPIRTIVNKAPVRKVKNRRIIMKAKKENKPLPVPPPPPTPSKNKKIKPVNFLDLKPWSCRYIVNEDKTNPFFCGAPKEIRSYCKVHADLCYIPSNWRKKWPIGLSALAGIILMDG
jgi:hypothetical protein